MKTKRERIFFQGIPLSVVAKLSGFSVVTVWRHAFGIREISEEAALRYEETMGINKRLLRPDLWPIKRPRKKKEEKKDA